MKIYECEEQIEKILNDYKFYSGMTNEINDIIANRVNQGKVHDQPDPKLIKDTVSFLSSNIKIDRNLYDDYIAKILLEFLTKLRDYYFQKYISLEIPTKTDYQKKEEKRYKM